MNQFKKAAFYTLGCKLNFSETSTISRLFEGDGYAKVDFSEPADIYVINTCSVTENADKKCKQLVKKAKNNNPDSYVIIIGCYAQLKPEEIAKLDGVDMVLGANDKFNVLKHLENIEKQEVTVIKNGAIKEVKEFFPSYSFGDRTRTFLKVQDGCDYFCSFCTIPLARGTSRSNSIAKTVEAAKEVAATGVKEVVLTGVNIGDFGKHQKETFLDLVKELDKVDGIERFRISSIEPNLLSTKTIEFVSESKKFVPHFHIPLQSGDDDLLLKMRRRYNQALYSERINTINKLIPNCCIGVDVIVGFPGETEERFLNTYNYLKNLEVSYLHVFTYSERANTTATRMEDAVPQKTRQERSKMLRILSEKKRRAFYEKNLDSSKTVLFESDNNNGTLNGFTENYVKVSTPYDPGLSNTLLQVELTTINSDGNVDCFIKQPAN